MPLNRWNESVFRYFYCRCLAKSRPDVEQFVECDRIDLVLRQGLQRAFVEFKFYQRGVRFRSGDGKPCGFKGGPTIQNRNEFAECIDRLHSRGSKPGTTKFVALLYADPVTDTRYTRAFSKHYDSYNHTSGTAAPALVENIEIAGLPEVRARAQLYEIPSAEEPPREQELPNRAAGSSADHPIVRAPSGPQPGDIASPHSLPCRAPVYGPNSPHVSRFSPVRHVPITNHRSAHLFPASFSYASIYLRRVPSTTSCGRTGAGGVLSQGCVSSQLRTNCLSKLSWSRPGA